MRVLTFSDGQATASSPSAGSVAQNALALYASDAAFVSAKGSAAADGDTYYDTARDIVRLYRNGAWTDNSPGALLAYASEAAFVSALGAAADGSFYYNTTLDAVRAYVNGAWETILSTDQGFPGFILNGTLAVSVGSNAITFALKTKAGENASATETIIDVFRSGTIDSGVYVVRKVTAALSFVFSSGSTSGTGSAVEEVVDAFLIDSAGTVEIAAVVGATFKPGDRVTTTAEGGAGAADTRYTLYSTTARTTVAAIYLGGCAVTEAAAGTWATAPSKVWTGARSPWLERSEVHLHTPNGHGGTNTKIRRFTTALINVGTGITYADSAGNGATFTINEEGLYEIRYHDVRSGASSYFGISKNSSQLTTNFGAITAADQLAGVHAGTGLSNNAVVTARLKPGDIIRAHSDGATDAADNNAGFKITKVGA